MVENEALLRITVDDLTAVPPQLTQTPALAARELFAWQLTNRIRRQHVPGWWPRKHLRWHNTATAVARGHALDMLKRGYIGHTTPDNQTLAMRLQQAGLGSFLCAENIGVAYGTNSENNQNISEIYAAFLSQPLGIANHRANLLNPLWAHTGIGLAFQPGGTLIMVQLFLV